MFYYFFYFFAPSPILNTASLLHRPFISRSFASAENFDRKHAIKITQIKLVLSGLPSNEASKAACNPPSAIMEITNKSAMKRPPP
jgi:hypothetical protein